jgi:hypothetical protein
MRMTPCNPDDELHGVREELNVNFETNISEEHND